MRPFQTLSAAVVMQVFVCRSGSAADTQNISAYVAHYLRQHEMDVGEPDVATAANIAMQIVYNNKVRPGTPEMPSASSLIAAVPLPATRAVSATKYGCSCGPASLLAIAESHLSGLSLA